MIYFNSYSGKIRFVSYDGLEPFFNKVEDFKFILKTHRYKRELVALHEVFDSDDTVYYNLTMNDADMQEYQTYFHHAGIDLTTTLLQLKEMHMRSGKRYMYVRQCGRSKIGSHHYTQIYYKFLDHHLPKVRKQVRLHRINSL